MIPIWLAIIVMVAWGCICFLAGPLFILLVVWLYIRFGVRRAVRK